MPILDRCRSALFMPASNGRAMAKARTLTCDVVILDLEDSVAPALKEEARLAAAAAIEGGFGERGVVLRLNAIDTAWFAADLDLAARVAVDAVLLPKASSLADIEAIRDRLGDHGPAIWAMIESARGLMALADLAASARRLNLAALIAGTNDLALDLRCRPGADRAPLLPALAGIVAAARAGGMTALDGVLNTIDDETQLAVECAQGRGWGFDGKTLIHPAQIDAANRAFGSSAEEIAWATRVIAAFADPAAIDRGAIRLDGAMVELLHLAEARRIVTLAG